MSIAMKLILSVVVFLVGSIIAGVIRDVVGVGQYIASGVIVLILFYIWSRPSPAKSSIEGENND